MVTILMMFPSMACAEKSRSEELLISPPSHGYFSRLPASIWEESMLTGNGRSGALVFGNPLNERIILSHEKLFMPEYPPYPAPPLHKYLDEMRELTLKGQGDEAAKLLVKAGEEVGINGMIWTNALIPACQLEIKSLSNTKESQYTRSVNYETGEATTAWKVGEVIFRRSIFFSRADDIGVLKITASKPGSLNFKFRLSQLPKGHGKVVKAEEEEKSNGGDLVSEFRRGARPSHLFYSTLFAKQWDGSLKGFNVDAQVRVSGGYETTQNEWLIIEGADEITILMDSKLSYSLPLQPVTSTKRVLRKSYTELLQAHRKIHADMFNRFSLKIGSAPHKNQTSEELLASSSFGKLKPELVNQLCEASRYALISSTGELPPTLQGIWGGTWRPAWSSDFTLNGNVPSVIACGLNTNLQELTAAYLDMMWSWFDDFRDNAWDMYRSPGIFVPSRASSSGKTYHYGHHYPHLLWYAGNAWTSQIFYDYWQYSGNEKFLRERAIPFMLASMEFYEFILTEDKQGQLNFLPSYSPEVGPLDKHPLAINATMDVAALKQLLRNLLKLADQGRLKTEKREVWETMLKKLPAYAIDKQGDLKEWIWPELRNNNQHRHASHLYPLFYEVDPDFKNNPNLMKAARKAIENRMKYRRLNRGAEMAFGLVQKGLAAAHIKDTKHAYECVDWLCSSYWSPALTSYHDPGSIFNLDICGGLPAVVAEMLIQSSAQTVELLPACPPQWPTGKISGVQTRCGVTVNLEWKGQHPTRVALHARRDTRFTLKCGSQTWPLELKLGQRFELTKFQPGSSDTN